jgi:hypothetical protein
MSTYSYSLDAIHLQRLQAAFVRQADRIGLYDKAYFQHPSGTLSG